ncbi:MAG TPA: fibronectin type III domain-containing protein [Smithellaceae bacterium]|nr:fibronectin type III domain-containing protein [Smithellaceae bacterium]
MELGLPSKTSTFLMVAVGLSTNRTKEVFKVKRSILNIIILLVLCFFLFPANTFASEAELTWDPPAVSTGVFGYMIHYGTASHSYSAAIDVGNVTSYTVSNLLDGKTYYFSVTWYDAAHVESELSGEVSLQTSDTTADVVYHGSCFIATAAFGSYLEPHVKILRDFRDRSLLTNNLGKAFVKFYYRHSPPIADVIREHTTLRYATRLVLFPIIYSIEYPYLMAVLLIIPAGLVLAYKRRRKVQESS